MSLHSGSLTLLTGSCPMPDSSIHVWPEKPRSHEMLGCLHASMREGMERRKHILSEILWYTRPGSANRYVTNICLGGRKQLYFNELELR